RRHTRLVSDWSSDVCSSDLGTNTLTGTAYDDIIDGGAGKDILVGGLGNDTYFVDSTGDKVKESLNAGFDTIYSFVSYTLPANVRSEERRVGKECRTRRGGGQ